MFTIVSFFILSIDSWSCSCNYWWLLRRWVYLLMLLMLLHLLRLILRHMPWLHSTATRVVRLDRPVLVVRLALLLRISRHWAIRPLLRLLLLLLLLW